jgi:peptide/nickel transport system permease protein
MLRYAIYRVLLLCPLLIGLSIVVFFYLQLIPGDPVAGMLGPAATPELVAQLRHEFGLDRPILVQYISWVEGLLRGDLGISFASRRPIAPILINRIPATLQLTVASMLVVVLVGWPAGFLAGLKKDTWIDRVLSVAVLTGLSSPVFLTGTILVLVFAIQFRWLPSQGYIPLAEDFGASMRATILPALTLGLALSPYLARLTRAATIEVQQEQFVRFAHAKGLKPGTVTRRYSARNAVIPIVVVLGLQFGLLLGGQVIVEELFSWPGMGRLIVRGAVERDYFMVQAVILVFSVIYVLINLGAELVHAWLDPRIRL